MKRSLAAALSILLLLGTVSFASAADDLVIDKTWQILLPENPTAAESFAAEKLRNCLGEVFGAQIEVTSSAQEKVIAVGAAATAASGVISPPPDGVSPPPMGLSGIVTRTMQ